MAGGVSLIPHPALSKGEGSKRSPMINDTMTNN
jgi:hypothetical protein